MIIILVLYQPVNKQSPYFLIVLQDHLHDLVEVELGPGEGGTHKLAAASLLHLLLQVPLVVSQYEQIFSGGYVMDGNRIYRI